jgi:hypothetical protein
LNPAWLFVIASIIAVIGILFAFRKMMSHIQGKVEKGKEINIESFQKEQTRFFIHVAIVEGFPILLIVFGFVQIEQLVEPVNILIPLVIIIAVFFASLFSVLTLRKDILGYKESSQGLKNPVNTFVFIGLIFLSAIPTVSIVALLIMAGI